MNYLRILPAVPFILLLASCSGGSDDNAITKPPESAEKLYNEARNKFDEGYYKDSIGVFEEVERQHPYSPWAAHSQVMSAYASYQMEDYDTAISTLDRFVKLYPNDESTPYAYYLIGLCYYEQISDVGRDQKITEQALTALREVVRRFPDSDYARDGKIKLDLTLDHLSGKEMQVGRYYLRHNDTLAAINRFRYVVENYQTTSHAPEALHRLVEAYLKLGVTEEAKRYAAVLGYNFPSSLWYRDSYKLMETVGRENLKPPSEKSAEKSGDETSTDSSKNSSWWDHLIP